MFYSFFISFSPELLKSQLILRRLLQNNDKQQKYLDCIISIIPYLVTWMNGSGPVTQKDTDFPRQLTHYALIQALSPPI